MTMFLPRNPNSRQLHRAYERGFAGWRWNPSTWSSFVAQSEFAANYSTPYFAESGRGKRALLWLSREKFDPGAFAQESQKTGDCVSHGSRNARDVTRCVEIHVKGEPEAYQARGATEPTYGARGHGGQGMDPAVAATFERDYGYLIRQKYGHIDLTTYDANLGIRWGAGKDRETWDDVCELCQDHAVRQVTVPDSLDQALDLFYNGYACHSGQYWGCKPTSDKYGMAVRSRGWNHDMATVGYDDTKEFYPECIFLVVNSWGDWNSEPAFWPRQYGPWISGSMVVPASQWEKYFLNTGSINFYGDIDGFPPKKLPDYGAGLFLE